MKYYFTQNCYWDDEQKQLFRNEVVIDLPTSQKKLLIALLKNNGRFVSHEVLYFAMTGEERPYGDWKASLSNKFTRNKESEKGLLIRVPEITPFFEKSKSQVGGGYKLSIPEENIVDLAAKSKTDWDVYRDIWHSNKYWETQQKKARISDKGWLDKKTKLYLQGEQCSWPLVFASSQYAPVKRCVVSNIIDAIENELGAIVLTGAGGEGKTTILMQLCVELYNAGKTVFYHAPTHKYDIPDDVVDGIFLVDNPSNTTEFKSFLTRATKEGLTVVIASRSNEWATLKETLFDDTRRSIKEIEIPKISSSESKAFAQYLKTHIHWIKRSVVELENLFLKDSCGFLYASMLMAIYNADSLEKIAEEIIERISKFENGDTALRILAAIVFAEQAGTAIGTRTYRTLCKHFSVDDRDVKYYLRKEVVLNGTVYQTRHKSISQLFYKYLFKDGDWWNYLNEEEREDVIIAVLDVYFEEVAKVTRDFKPTEHRAIEIANLILQALEAIDYEETQEFIVQRVFESCQQHGHAIINRVYHHTSNEFVRNALATKCFDSKLPVWEIYNHWVRHLIKTDEQFETIYNILQTLCVELGAPVNTWNSWINALKIHFSGEGEEYLLATREIYLMGFQYLPSNSTWWGHWASFEAEHGNVGSPNDEHTARWIFKEGCSHNPTNPHLWLEWIDLEIQLSNIGLVDKEYTARWIANEGCDKTDDTHLWIKRAEIELLNNNSGDIFTEGTGRWYLRMATTKYPNAAHIWIKWAEVEESCNNIGNYETPNSAAWIYKEACTNHGRVTDPAIWLKWVDFVLTNNLKANGGDVECFSPTMILKLACIEHTIPSSQVWLKWARLEEESGNIGSYETAYSAAWIYKETCEKNIDGDDMIWVSWANFIERNKGILSPTYSPEIIFKNKCLSGTTSVSPWMAWAIVEETQGNVGNYLQENSAAWIIREGCLYHNPTDDAACLIKWARFAHKNPLEDEDGTLIDAKYVLDYAQRTCIAFSNQMWIDLDNFKKEIGYQ